MNENPLLALFPWFQGYAKPQAKRTNALGLPQVVPPSEIDPMVKPTDMTTGVELSLMERARMAAMDEMARLQKPKTVLGATRPKTLLDGFGSR